jgi:cellulose synthase/poly-beta-1,6-N-acetylglucosamine synthase-like glycosyltransferase
VSLSIAVHKLLISLFWGAVSLTLYTYVGYPVWAFLRSRLWPRPWQQATIFPNVSVILVVHNGAALLLQKINQLLSLDYPRDRIEFIVVSDGCTDATNRILRSNPFVRSIICPERRGKAAGLNVGIQNATGEILVFLDVRQRLESTSFHYLLSNFTDPGIGCAGGEVLLSDNGHDQETRAVSSMYWRYEKWIRQCESRVDSPVGVSGAFYAVRRQLVCTLPEACLLDDVLQPLSIIRKGYRSVLDARAVVYDVPPRNFEDEFRRKVRTLAGNFQLLKLAPWLLSSENRLRFELISHKLMRLIVPVLLVILLATSAMLAIRSQLYTALFAAQLLFYLAAALGTCRGVPILAQIAGAARAFCMMNIAVVVGFYRFISTRRPLWSIWIPTAPPPEASTVSIEQTPHADAGVGLSIEPLSSEQTDWSTS